MSPRKTLYHDDKKDDLEAHAHRTPSQSRSSMMRTSASLLVGSLATALLLFVVGGSASPFYPPHHHLDPRTPTSRASHPVDKFTAPARFPKGAFEGFYSYPKAFETEPRPKVIDAKTGKPFPDLLAGPLLPDLPPASDAVFPKPGSGSKNAPEDLAAQIQKNITAIIADGSLSNCSKCINSLKLGQQLAALKPREVPGVLQSLCKQFKYSPATTAVNATENCNRVYAPQTLGAMYAQVLRYANLEGDMPSDGQYICSYVYKNKACPTPAPLTLDQNFLNGWFGSKSKRDEIVKREALVHEDEAHKRTGEAWLDKRGNKKMFRVAHLSDIHVDPRFLVGAEAGCTTGQCCRADSFNSTLASGPPLPQGTLPNPANRSQEAYYWGNYKCDAPWSLAMSALQSVTPLNGDREVDMSLYTGDMVVHDAPFHISDDLVRYTQQSIFDSMKRYFGKGPVFSAIGNHDTAPSDSSAPRDLPPETVNAFSYDWENLQRLFVAEGWFTHKEAKQVATHYGGYSVSPRKGLRIITVNSDFWYKSNVYNFINTTNPDASGMLRWLTDELIQSEARSERVWIVGHVLTGWDGTNPLANPTNLFYQIVDHFSPKTIAHIFLGHTHEDQFNVFYANNASSKATVNAKAVSFIGPSVTPLTNVNPSIRYYTVDPETYSVMDIDQYYAQAQGFPELPKAQQGLTWQHLYSARSTYGNFSASAADTNGFAGPVKLDSGGMWPAAAPLNATFWSQLTYEMEKRPELMKTFTTYQGRNSPKTKPCNDECTTAKICYMRSGSAPIGLQCPQGFGSVQS